MSVIVKVCGLKTADALETAVDAGADMVGFVFFERSPRAVAIDAAAALCARTPADVIRTGLFVNADDTFLDSVLKHVSLDLLQLHGVETTDRVAEVRTRFGLPVMKALPVSSPTDVAAARHYESVCDRLLFDAKPPKDADRPGGNALAFDWSLLSGTAWRLPWLLAGGLTPENVAEAIQIAGAPGVDVSSGVEDTPGVKSPAKIRAFLNAARTGRAARHPL